MRWRDLESETSILDALNHAGTRSENWSQNEKRHWSEKFANGCAVAVAKEFRKSPVKKKIIRPESLEKGTEPLTPLGASTQKRIDVTVVDSVLGLEIGVSLKGFNWKDSGSNAFDKNFTGRLYELGDEVRLVHEHLPHAFMVGVLFLPIDSTNDKKSDTSASSFARAVIKLRERTGRLDAALPSQASKCDAGYVCLYVTGDEIGGFRRGAARFINVKNDPPVRGRPKVQDTLSLSEVIDEIVGTATHSLESDWADPETED